MAQEKFEEVMAKRLFQLYRVGLGVHPCPGRAAFKRAFQRSGNLRWVQDTFFQNRQIHSTDDLADILGLEPNQIDGLVSWRIHVVGAPLSAILSFTKISWHAFF